jgi:hypothetical protein
MAVTIKWKTGREPHANEQLLAAHLQPYREVPSAASVRAVVAAAITLAARAAAPQSGLTQNRRSGAPHIL